jgi:hypothetical protein
VFGTLDEGLEEGDLLTGLVEWISQSHGDLGIGILDQGTNPWDDLFGAERDEDAELS